MLVAEGRGHVYCKQRCPELPRGLPAGDPEEEAAAAVNPQSPDAERLRTQTSNHKGSDGRREARRLLCITTQLPSPSRTEMGHPGPMCWWLWFPNSQKLCFWLGKTLYRKQATAAEAHK